MTSVSDKVTIVLQVAKTVQNTLSSIADNLEKINSLLTWKHPAAMRYLLTGLCAALVFSAVLPATTFFRLAGLYIGVKLFIIDTMYETFPRLRQRRDTVYRYWQELPTNADVTEHRTFVEHQVATLGGDSSQLGRQPSVNGRAFCESFFLPLEEKPVPDKYLLEEDQQDGERDSIVVLRGMGRGRQARKTCPTVLETVPVAGPSDQRDSERGTSCYSRFVGKGAGRELVEPVSYPHHLPLADVMKERMGPLSQR
ncbi:hypothetical protein LSAT2_001832 [Lamellibrachia satsuma]|nr:hypothetical protein LSAT2_001832 [Lamellibrachia satsuma]